LPVSLPLVQTGYSLKPDMKFGWWPDIEPINGAPIPLYYDYEVFEEPELDKFNIGPRVVYYGFRPINTHHLHWAFSKPNEGKYWFQFPPPNAYAPPPDWVETPREYEGMNPKIKHSIWFDSKFESGNLDMVVKWDDFEYDLYMWVDTNTRGHHQWFFFSVENLIALPMTVKFNIVNFTKRNS